VLIQAASAYPTNCSYSSIYVASAVTLGLGISKEDLIPAEIEIEVADQDELRM
jgi:hypothetical protein